MYQTGSPSSIRVETGQSAIDDVDGSVRLLVRPKPQLDKTDPLLTASTIERIPV